MNPLILPLLALAGGLMATLLQPYRRVWASWIGVATAVAAAIVALGITADQAVSIGDADLAGSDLLRLVAFGWASGIAILGAIEIASGRPRAVAGPALLGLAVGAFALSIDDPATAFAALGGGGVAAILVPTLTGWAHGREDPWRIRTALRGMWAIVGSGLLGIAVVAWAASPVGPLGNGSVAGSDEMRAASSLALLGIVAAVVVRAGLIPAHVWAARFIESVSPLAVPAALIWGSACFMLVSLGWAQVAVGPETTGVVERDLIILVGIASIAFGGLAAMVHDDLEHVLGYSMLQDGGVAILAFASLHTQAADAAHDWLLASAMLKSAFAAWVAVMRSTFGAHRLADLRGWIRASPVLALALGVIGVGAVGVPGMALFTARVVLIDGVFGGLLGSILFLAAMTPIVYLGRIAVIGTGPASAAVAAAPSARPHWSGGRASGWSGRPILGIARAVPEELRANRAPLVAAAVLVLAALGFGYAAIGVGG